MNNLNEEECNIPISSIAEFIYCKRKWYLRSIEKSSAENIFMIEGRIQHEEVHTPKIINNGEKIVVTNLQVYSLEYGINGFCDKVEFNYSSDGVMVPFCDYPVSIVPIEYKHGKVREIVANQVQVVVQAMCLEEMFNCSIKRGYVHYVDANENQEVVIDDRYRSLVKETVSFIRQYDGSLIPPSLAKKCNGCAMSEICQPKKYNIDKYMKELWNNL